jgi:leucyl/phenylalanyl-tRNA---protein transferase
MPVYWLSEEALTFPHPELASRSGLLAAGGDLSPERLLLAYQQGIFPWYNPDDPILWWSPDPRFVLFPAELKVARSMRPYFNNSRFELTADSRFEQIMRLCAQAPRKGQPGGTWISEEMIEGYVRLHQLGFAHSVEVWQNEALVGGLYGIALGKCFFGESMFAAVSNASKYAFIALARRLEELGYQLIDCQQQTGHLASLGARPIRRKVFLEYLEINRSEPTHRGNWSQIFEKDPPSAS